MAKKDTSSLSYYLKASTGSLKESFFKKEFAKARAILSYQNKSENYSKMITASSVLAAVGVIVGLIASNPLLSVALAIGLSLIPVWMTVMSQHKYKMFVADELESGLAIISTTYQRHNNFVAAVEENLAYLNSPLKDVMTDFIAQVKLVNPNVSVALLNIKPQIHNTIWSEWINEVIKCQTNHTLKPSLMNIVSKLSDVKMVQSDLDTLVNNQIKEFKMLLMIVVFALPGIYAINQEWFSYFFTRLPGKISLAAVAVILFVSIAKMVTISKPVEYKR